MCVLLACVLAWGQALPHCQSVHVILLPLMIHAQSWPQTNAVFAHGRKMGDMRVVNACRFYSSVKSSHWKPLTGALTHAIVNYLDLQWKQNTSGHSGQGWWQGLITQMSHKKEQVPSPDTSNYLRLRLRISWDSKSQRLGNLRTIA